MPEGHPERARELFVLVESSPWFVLLLASVSRAGLPDAWVGAGVIRDLVWDTKFRGRFDPALVKDVDVVYFDPADLGPERDHAAELRLQEIDPGVAWDAKNQAAVHTWYPERFGLSIEPYLSVEDAVRSWPDTATCVAIRRSSAGELDLIAPYGLDDLLDGIWRFNPLRVTAEEARRRLQRKHVASRWPGLSVYPPGVAG
jgi:hypothetical protein